MSLCQYLASRSILDAVRVPGEIDAGWADFEAVCLRALVKGLRGKCTGDRDKGDVRLFAKRKTKPKRAMGCQITDEKVRQRLAIVLRFFVAATIAIRTGATFDDLAVVLDGVAFAVLQRFRFRHFILAANEATFDARRSVMRKDDEYAATRNNIRIKGVTQGVDALDLGFEPAKTLIDIVRQFLGAILRSAD
jgi:hypothetical protein